VPKFELDFCQDHWGGPIDPKLCGPSSYVNQTWFASKKHISRTFAQLTPSANLSYLTTNWPDFCHFCMISLHFNKEYHCNNNGAKRSSSWPGTPFWPISLRKIQQKGGKPSPTKSGFQHPIRFLIIKEVLLSCFEVNEAWELIMVPERAHKTSTRWHGCQISRVHMELGSNISFREPRHHGSWKAVECDHCRC